MTIGHLFTWVAFLASLVAAYFYFTEEKSRNKKRTGRLWYRVVVLAGILTSAVLFYALLTHQFEYRYVASYSSRSLPLLYLISSFWAGQEGTFLLWAVMVGIIGLFFQRNVNHSDGYAMAVVSAFSAFLYLLLIAKSPFEELSPVPPDGAGLNPLLQDPWMAIHPPILFIGYAATLFPFALVISGLARKRYELWLGNGFRWVLFASLTLGAGIIIGGFWAYEVLGWGGYWGWDPVENSSLVPWLVLIALIHGLLIQKTKGSLLRTNMLLAIISFILVTYATFLTRSGVLTDFSVHSFVDLGISNYLVGAIVVSVVLGFGIFIMRFRSIESPKLDLSGLNREMMLLFGLVVLSAGALFTFVGMSSPILTGFFGKASQVEVSFYNRVMLPVGIGIALLLGITPFLGWGEEKNSGLIRRLTMPLALTALACVIAYVAGVTSPVRLLFTGSAAFGLISNMVIVFRQYRAGWLGLGGPIAHIGAALLLIGIIGSGWYDETTKAVLPKGQMKDVLGHRLTYLGADEQTSEKVVVKIEVSDGSSTFLATPKLQYSEMNRSYLREPFIKIYPLKDLYISPVEVQSSTPQDAHPMIELTKGETKQMGGYGIQFVSFDMTQHGGQGGAAVGAILRVTMGGKEFGIVPRLGYNERGEPQYIPADLPLPVGMKTSADTPRIAFVKMSVEEKKVWLSIIGVGEASTQASVEQLLVEVSTKPLMMVVWTGVVLILGGGVLAYRKRTL